jgi:beta-lactamase superfamily II metal-dependent hydrolase
MTEEIQIRLVHVEFLRPGPPHNQLLSPLTQYLAIAGDAGAGVVTVPYEQGQFWRHLKQLRYETGDAEDRLAMLHGLGVEMGKILGAVPGLPGALTMGRNQQGTLIQLRITLSASELSMLPFELAKAPVSATTTAENWLSIQTRPPVCVTRNIRTVSPEGVIWPDRPRILFISGNPSHVPYTQHREELLTAIKPFQYPGEDDVPVKGPDRAEYFGKLLTIMENPTLSEVFRECRRNVYTHVHILTHGDLSETSPDSYGLVLRGPDDSAEVVSGDQFASALTSVSGERIHRPTVVTVASCDSGNVGTVILPGASFAHALHQAGIPLVVASQFPLSKEGSIPLAATLYQGLLWGQHPLVLLQQLRAELHARYTSSWHDWASLVVYEALPQALPEQLETLRYFQTKRAINAVLERIDQTVRKSDSTLDALKALDKEIESAVGRLPLRGPYAAECVGIRASSRKRLAQAAFRLSSDATRKEIERWRDPYELLDEAHADYQSAARSLMVVAAGSAQRVATLHWLLVQIESMALILGREANEGRAKAARLSAEMYLDHEIAEERAWAHASLAELCLIGLGDLELKPEQRKDLSERAVKHVREIARLYPRRDEFPVRSTRSQFKRYVEWWGSETFEQGLEKRRQSKRPPWGGELGIVTVAQQLVSILHREDEDPADDPKAALPSGGTGGDPGAGSQPPPGDGGGTLAEGRGSRRARPARTREARRRAFFEIDMLPAGHGDSLWIEYGDDDRNTHRVLIDCGTQQTASELLRRVEALPARERFFELFLMSHIDSDHIGGALPFFKAVRDDGLRFGDVWFNGWRHLSGHLGARQGEMFSTAIQDFELPWNVLLHGEAVVIDAKDDTPLPVWVLPGGMRLTLLSPTPAQLRKLAPAWTRELKRYGLTPGGRVDYSRFLKGKPSTSTDVDALAAAQFASDHAAPNGSSIAVLAEYGGASALLAADAHAPVLVQSIRKLLAERGGADRLKIDAFKVSHHASQNNVSTELMSLLDCPRFLISTNGSHFYHPDREAVARLIKHGRPETGKPELIFNYRTGYNDVWERADLQEQHGFTTVYPDVATPGQLVSLLP